MANDLKTAFEMLRDALNDALVPTDFKYPASLSPKHPDFVEKDDEFPYFGFRYRSEDPEYEGSDYWWILPSREMASFDLYMAISQSSSDSLSADLMAKVKKVRDVVKTLTGDRTHVHFRCRVSGVRADYAQDARWGLAVCTIIIGAYGD